MAGISGPDHIRTKQIRIAHLAKEDPTRVMTSLAHLVDEFWLYEAYRRTPKDKASGFDGVTAKDYEKNLMGNLRDLAERFKSGTNKAPTIKRIYLPKDGGKKRPIGLPTFEDKILQRGVKMLLEPVYEQDFLDLSYGFRPGRSQHQALDAVWKQLMDNQGGWVLEVDIKGFFDNIEHRRLREFLDRRVRDGVIRRMIDKWLRAGILEEGVIWHPMKGTPQGGVLSPLLSNIFLHELVDKWFVEVVTPRMMGAAKMFRFADDIIMNFRHKRDAESALSALRKRMEEYGLELHPEKTRLVYFQRPFLKAPWGKRKVKQPGSFDFLGFTLHWKRSRKGNWVVGRRTRKARLKRSLAAIKEWCRKNRHLKIKVQHEQLSLKLKGHYAYYGVTGNSESLGCFYHEVKFIWWKWLNRRSQHRHLPIKKFFRRLSENPLPWPKIVHSVYRPQRTS